MDDEEKAQEGPLIRREAQTATVGRQLEEELTKVQLVLAHTGENYQQLADCARNAYNTVTLGLVIAKAENDTLRSPVERADWNEVAQRIFAAVTQLGVLQCSMKPEINFSQVDNRMRSVYDTLTRLYLGPSEILQEKFPCSSSNNREVNEQPRPLVKTEAMHYDDSKKKLIKQERNAFEEKIIKQEKCTPEDEVITKSNLIEDTSEENQLNQRIEEVWKRLLTELNKHKKRGRMCPRCRKGAHPVRSCPLPRKRGRGSKERSKIRRKINNLYKK